MCSCYNKYCGAVSRYALTCRCCIRRSGAALPAASPDRCEDTDKIHYGRWESIAFAYSRKKHEIFANSVLIKSLKSHHSVMQPNKYLTWRGRFPCYWGAGYRWHSPSCPPTARCRPQKTGRCGCGSCCWCSALPGREWSSRAASSGSAYLCASIYQQDNRSVTTVLLFLRSRWWGEWS